MYNLNWKEIRKVTPYHRFQNHNRSSQWRCSVKKMLLKTLQISHWNTCVGIFICWFEDQFLITPILKNTCKRLLLSEVKLLKDNSFTITKPHRRHFSWNYSRFCEVALDGGLSQQPKICSVLAFKVTLKPDVLYDTTCMTHNRLSNFYSVYTIILVVQTNFIKVVLKDYSAFKSSNKIIQEQAAKAVIIALISEKNKSRKKRKKRRVCETLA